MIYESQDCSVNYSPYGGLPEGAGLFGGYPAGIGGIRAAFKTEGRGLMERLREKGYPTRQEQLVSEGWGSVDHPAELRGRIPLPEYHIITEFVGGGGGYGDPLERAPEQVARDVKGGIVSPRVAEHVYGVALAPGSSALNREATEKRRREIREERLREGKPYRGATSGLPKQRQSGQGWERVLRFHEHLEVARSGRTQAIRCIGCGHLFCEAGENYKLYALQRARDLQELAQQGLPSGEPYIGGYHEYYCPGCATLLQVDTFCRRLPGWEEPMQDFWAKV
jgi:hypothetical protein